MIGQQENNRTLYHQKLGTNRKTCNHFLKSRCISELSWYFFEKYKCSGIAFFLQSSRYASTEQPCLKQMDYMTILYFYLVCFSFVISYSELPFHLLMFPNFSISSFFFSFLKFFLKTLSSKVEKFLYTYK